eukprot:TRINITY_DN8635_c0_g1_i3.p4 TRINITY_DN8635_c0_g1~~TRINITY_DN8635_c0_g1_i3.p4  ORF type:complete len:215 (-),score=10.60 TRINITY_DN8635_c0_g1_i3:167-811(-)
MQKQYNFEDSYRIEGASARIQKAQNYNLDFWQLINQQPKPWINFFHEDIQTSVWKCYSCPANVDIMLDWICTNLAKFGGNYFVVMQGFFWITGYMQPMALVGSIVTIAIAQIIRKYIKGKLQGLAFPLVAALFIYMDSIFGLQQFASCVIHRGLAVILLHASIRVPGRCQGFIIEQGVGPLITSLLKQSREIIIYLVDEIVFLVVEIFKWLFCS